MIGMENLDITGFPKPMLTSIQLPTEEVGTIVGLVLLIVADVILG